jgi:hypothetical protein
MIPRFKWECQQAQVTTTETYYIQKYIYDNSLACRAELTSFLFAEEGVGSLYIGLPSSLVSKRDHKYVTFGEEGVPRNSDMRQVMYGNYVREHKVACPTAALLCLKSWERQTEWMDAALLPAQSFLNARYRDLARGW